MQARLNLNDLLAPEGEFSPAQKRFIRLLQVVDEDIDSVAATALANAVFDWIDPDADPRYPGGAEAFDYLRLPQPYRPANQSFASVSELRLVRGFSGALVAALTPHVSVWGNGNLNLNTMDAHLAAAVDVADSIVADPAAVPIMLRTLNNSDSLSPLGVDGARLLAAARRNGGGVLQNFDLFDAAPFSAQDWDLAGVALTSAFFELNAVMQTPRRAYAMTAVLRRAVDVNGVPEITIMSRRYGGVETESASCAAAVP
jgi:general secretion pathway protein K